MNFSVSDYLDDYEKISNELKFVSNSIIRLKLLATLKSGGYSMKEISSMTKLSYCSLSTNVNNLELKNLVYRESGKYYLENIMEIYLDNLLDVDNVINFIEEHFDFIYNHNISAISDDALTRLDCLNDCEIITSSPTEFYKSQDLIESCLKEANEIKAIFPYSYLSFPDLINDIIENNVNLEVFFHKNIFKSILKKVDLTKDNFIYNSFNDDSSFLLVVTDKMMVLGLYLEDDGFDRQRLLISKSKNSIKWAKKVYKNFKEENYLKYSSK